MKGTKEGKCRKEKSIPQFFKICGMLSRKSNKGCFLRFHPVPLQENFPAVGLAQNGHAFFRSVDLQGLGDVEAFVVHHDIQSVVVHAQLKGATYHVKTIVVGHAKSAFVIRCETEREFLPVYFLLGLLHQQLTVFLVNVFRLGHVRSKFVQCTSYCCATTFLRMLKKKDTSNFICRGI